MDSDEDSDTHLCLKCRKTIVGLDNYVNHKRGECPSILAARARKDNAANGPDQRPTRPEHDPPENAFFLSLELQSASRPQPCESTHFDDVTTRPFEAESGLMPYTPHDVTALDTADVFYVEPDHIYGAPEPDDNGPEPDSMTDDDPEVDDHRHPPRSHTGGKWRPAAFGDTSPPPPYPTPPVTSGTHRYNTRRAVDRRPAKCRRCGNVHPPFSRHCAAPLEKQARRRICVACGNLSFHSVSALIDHLASPSCRGWQRDGEDPAHHHHHVQLVLYHSEQLAPRAPFRCELCRFYFNAPEELLRHWSTAQPAHEERLEQGQRFSCSHCDGSFGKPFQLWQHLTALVAPLDHGGLVRLTPLVTDAVLGSTRCTICERECSSFRGLAIHMGRMHKIDDTARSELDSCWTDSEEDDYQPSPKQKVRRWRCRECRKVFDGRQTLLHHVSATHPECIFECRHCCQSYLRRTDLEAHLRTLRHRCYKMEVQLSTNDEVTSVNFTCMLCPFTTVSSSALTFHQVVTHETSAEEKDDIDDTGSIYFCPECHDGPLQIQQLRLHLTLHTKETPTLVCMSCSVIFDSEEDLLAHDRSRHKSKNLTCDQCNFTTHRNNKLTVHKEQHSSDRKRKYLCHNCAASFYSSSSLRNHLKKHFKQRVHRCEFKDCTRAFRSAFELTEHRRTHASEKPFLCDTCGYSSKTRSQLLKHHRSHSTGEKRYRCTQPGCSFAANLNSGLRRHQRLHSGAKPYKCRHCNYACNTQENLRKHVLKGKIHAGLNVYPCPKCSFGCDFVAEMERHLAEQHDLTGEDCDQSFVSRTIGVYRRNDEENEPLKVVPVRYVPLSKTESNQQDGNYSFEKDCDVGNLDSDGHQRTSYDAAVVESAEFYPFESEHDHREEIVFTFDGGLVDEQQVEVVEIGIGGELVVEETIVVSGELIC